MRKGRIDVIIPCYKAHGTIFRTLSSIASQTILSDVDVTLVNDACPDGDYSQFVNLFKPYMSIKEVKLNENGGPGVARQAGIDATDDEFFTCMDADDTLVGALALEILREGISIDNVVKCCSAAFTQLGDNLQTMAVHQNDMVWMFGKIYRREFIDQYKIRFNETRANEDTGFNTMVKLLCDNPTEQVRFITENVYYWHNKENSITRINDGQYAYDQCLCGWTDNMIDAINHVRKCKPFSGAAIQSTVQCLLNLYYYYVETLARKPVFAEQNWEYVKKYYHAVYKRIEDDISDEIFGQMFSATSQEKWASGSLFGIVPEIGIHEFMDKLKSDEYDSNHIYDIWQKMNDDPEAKKLIENNVQCGVCHDGYWNKPFV